MDKNQLQNGKSLAEIQSLLKSDPGFQQKLKQRLIDESNQVSNPFQIIFSLFSKGILSDGSKTVGGIVGLKEMIVQAVITTACSNGDDAIAALLATLEESGNSQVIAAIGTWCEDNFALKAHNGCSKPGGNPVVKAPTPADLPKEMKNAVGKKERVAVGLTREKPAVAGTQSSKQTAPSNELQEVARFHCPKECPLDLELDTDNVSAYLADGTIQLWNRHGRDDENKMINCAVKDVTCMQRDHEILVVGTAGGTVYLFDVRTLEEKFSMRFGERVHLLKFAESTLVLLTRKDYVSNLWQVNIRRREMELHDRKSLAKVSQNLGLLFDLDREHFCFSSSDSVVSILNTKTGYKIENYNNSRTFSAKTKVIILKVAELISCKRILVAGCENGDILVWRISWENLGYMSHWILEVPIKTLQGHEQPVHNLCTVNGHLISLDKSGKVLMWSGYDLGNQGVPEPVPRVLAEDFHNVICLVGHERWFASASSDGTISIWNLPDLWLRTG